MSDERILDKLDKIEGAVQETKLDIVEIRADLNNHIRRTDLAEQNIVIVKEESNKRLTKLEKFSEKFHYLGWIISGVLAVVEALDKLHLLK